MTKLADNHYDEDWFEEVISDSLDMDWHPRDAARLIMARLAGDNAAVVRFRHAPEDLRGSAQYHPGDDL